MQQSSAGKESTAIACSGLWPRRDVRSFPWMKPGKSPRGGCSRRLREEPAHAHGPKRLYFKAETRTLCTLRPCAGISSRAPLRHCHPHGDPVGDQSLVGSASSWLDRTSPSCRYGNHSQKGVSLSACAVHPRVFGGRSTHGSWMECAMNS